MKRFDALLSATSQDPSAKAWRDALARVGDTALICRAWLEECTPNYTPADVVAMTRIVIERETEDRNRADRIAIFVRQERRTTKKLVDIFEE